MNLTEFVVADSGGRALTQQVCALTPPRELRLLHDILADQYRSYLSMVTGRTTLWPWTHVYPSRYISEHVLIIFIRLIESLCCIWLHLHTKSPTASVKHTQQPNIVWLFYHIHCKQRSFASRGQVKNYPTMHYFGIPRHTRSIAYPTRTKFSLSHWNLNSDISLMANSLNLNSVYFYIFRNLWMIAYIIEIHRHLIGLLDVYVEI